MIINEQLLGETRKKFKNSTRTLRKSVEKRYEYFNPLLLCKTFEEIRCDEAVVRSPVFCLGAYLFRIFYKVYHHNYFPENINDFEFFDNNCIIFLNQIKIYANIMKELKIEENSDLFQQTFQKYKFFEFLLDLVTKDKNSFKNYIVNSETNTNFELIPNVINLEDINKNGE